MKFSEWLHRKDENLYGVYCGPGPKLGPTCDTLASGDPMPQPTDELDGVCKQHDIDYCKASADWRAALPFGRHKTPKTVDADKRMLVRIRQLRRDGKLNPNAEWFARIINRYFRFSSL
jgi:hypothetical protein